MPLVLVDSADMWGMGGRRPGYKEHHLVHCRAWFLPNGTSLSKACTALHSVRTCCPKLIMRHCLSEERLPPPLYPFPFPASTHPTCCPKPIIRLCPSVERLRHAMPRCCPLRV